MPKSAWSHDNFLVTLVISSGIFLVNYLLMNSAASAFYSTGIDMINLQDSMSLVEQVTFVSHSHFFLLVLAMVIKFPICNQCRHSRIQ